MIEEGGSGRPGRPGWLSRWGFSGYERRALLFLIVLLVAGSAVRFYRHRQLSKGLPLWVETVERLQAADSSGAVGRASTAARPSVDYPLDLNTASAIELELLPGVGPKKAADIIAFRRTRGPFKTVDELEMVRGIGPKTLERVKPLLTVRGAPRDTSTSAEPDKYAPDKAD